MRALEPWHIIVLVVVVAILFGGKRLPSAARGLGQSLRIFKTEMQEMGNDKKTPASDRTERAEKAERPAEPLEGRVVGRNEQAANGTTSANSEQRHDV